MGIVEVLARVAVLGVELALALPLLYLAVLSVAALVPRRWAGQPAPAARGGNAAAEASAAPRFALLIPAHDEARVIGELLTSIALLDYPVALRDVYLIADNCTDATADITREAGVPGLWVRERQDDSRRGKGYALRWFLEELEREGHIYEAYVVVDADSQLSANFLREMAAGLASGADVTQGQYRVQNAVGAWTASLRAIAFALMNHLRPLGRSTLGWSAGLKGNGMCFSRAVIQRFGWGSYTLAEDAEYHLTLVNAGVRVRYVPAAVVTSAMPTSLAQARSQQQRWERGRLVLARSHAAPLVRGAIEHRDLARLDAIVEVCLPPISLLAGLLAAVAIGAVALWWAPGMIGAGLLILAFALHVVAGMALARLAPRAYLALACAPWYVLWKIGIYVAAAVRRGSDRWVRTSRVAAPSGGADGR